jgi:superfamily I DNA/RNA helicase
MPSAFGKTLAMTLAESRLPNRVLFSTVKKFKGLEADAVVIVDVGPGFLDVGDGNELYVACTRGKSRLAVMCTSQTVVDRLKKGR